MANLSPSRSFFDLWSLTYDNPLAQALVYRPVQDAVMASLRHQRPACVLDIGCGTGLLTRRIGAELGASVVGLDYSRGMLRQASRRGGRPSWVQANALNLPVGAAAVDAIVCTESFHWYPDQALALREFERVLRPGGVVYVAVVTAPHARVSDDLHRLSTRYGQPFYWPTRQRMRSMVIESGLELLSQRRVRRIPTGLAFAPALTIARRSRGAEPLASDSVEEHE
ncbi:MAG TPA: methyltransferase domain-containing protein [Acidimicrobiales bacterium]